MAAADIWFDEVAVNAPGVSRDGMTLAINGAISEFFRRSGAYAKAIPDIRIVAGRDTYIIPKQEEGPILYIHAVFYDNRPLPFADGLSWERLSPGTGAPRLFRAYVDDPYKIRVHPTPTESDTDGLTPYVAFGFDPACQPNLPAMVTTQWYDVILSGAIFRLAAQPRKPYTDATLAGLHGRLFRAGIATAREQARRQFVGADEAFFFPAWA